MEYKAPNPPTPPTPKKVCTSDVVETIQDEEKEQARDKGSCLMSVEVYDCSLM